MAGSKQRDKKKKRQEEVAEKKRALSSPESLQIHYQDLRSGGSVETKGLSEFLIWAKKEKVAIFTKEYHDYAIFNKPPAVEEKAKFWCPALETACMIPQNTAEEFYEFRNAMYVDNFTKPMYEEAVVQVIAREKAFRMHRSLMSEESQPPVESQSELAEPEAKEQELVEPEAIASQSDFLEAEVNQIHQSDQPRLLHPKEEQLVEPLQVEDAGVKEDAEEKAGSRHSSYYNVGQECLEEAYIISPSFENISSSDKLIDGVLAGRSVAFCNIDYLHANHKMWLVSM